MIHVVNLATLEEQLYDESALSPADAVRVAYALEHRQGSLLATSFTICINECPLEEGKETVLSGNWAAMK